MGQTNLHRLSSLNKLLSCQNTCKCSMLCYAMLHDVTINYSTCNCGAGGGGGGGGGGFSEIGRR